MTMFFPLACVNQGLQEPIPEFRFEPSRKWRVDWYWPEHRLALEIEGGVWTQGRHNRAMGFLRDIEKYNELTLAGIRLIRVTPQMIEDGQVWALLRRAMGRD